MTDGPINRREAQTMLDAAVARLEQLRAALPNATTPRRRANLQKRIDALEAETNRHFAILNPPAIGSPFDGPTEDDALLCDYCHDYRFHSTSARYQHSGVCPRCNPDPTVYVDPHDPNWRETDGDAQDEAMKLLYAATHDPNRR